MAKAKKSSDVTKQAAYQLKDWQNILDSKPPQQTITLIEGISIEEDAGNKAALAHYQYGASFESKLRAILQLDPKPHQVIFVPTGELHRHNKQAEANLSDQEALKAGQEESQFWIDHHESSARSILEEQGINVSIIRWQEFLNTHTFKEDNTKVRAYYDADENFRKEIEKLVEGRINSTLNRLAQQPKIAQAIKKTAESLKKNNPSDQQKVTIFNDIRPIFVFFSKERKGLFEMNNHVEKLLQDVASLLQATEISREWSKITQTFIALQQATFAKHTKFSKDYLLEEAASAQWMRSLAGNHFLINTYKEKENPAWHLAADKVFNCLPPFLPYKFIKQTAGELKNNIKEASIIPISETQVLAQGEISLDEMIKLHTDVLSNSLPMLNKLTNIIPTMNRALLIKSLILIIKTGVEHVDCCLNIINDIPDKEHQKILDEKLVNTVVSFMQHIIQHHSKLSSILENYRTEYVTQVDRLKNIPKKAQKEKTFSEASDLLEGRKEEIHQFATDVTSIEENIVNFIQSYIQTIKKIKEQTRLLKFYDEIIKILIELPEQSPFMSIVDNLRAPKPSVVVTPPLTPSTDTTSETKPHNKKKSLSQFFNPFKRPGSRNSSPSSAGSSPGPSC